MHAFDACMHSMHASKPGSRKDPGMPILMARTPRPVAPGQPWPASLGRNLGFGMLPVNARGRGQPFRPTAKTPIQITERIVTVIGNFAIKKIKK